MGRRRSCFPKPNDAKKQGLKLSRNCYSDTVTYVARWLAETIQNQTKPGGICPTVADFPEAWAWVCAQATDIVKDDLNLAPFGTDPFTPFGTRPPVPLRGFFAACAYSTQTGQPFHRKLDTCSAANWTAVPGQTGPSERSAARG